ncbi:MAG TPA: thioredoxin domain-containing protein [Holophagaceae bacterium]
MIRPIRSLCLVVLAWLSGGGGLEAQQPSPVPEASLREQIQALQEGQRRILAELAAIQARLGTPSALPKPGAIVSVNVHGEPFRGAAAARVAILEYSDFDCPFCAKFANGTLRQLESDYIQSGRVKYFFRDLPLPEHPQADYKAQVARCAGAQGKFWEAHDRLFSDLRPLDAFRLAAFIHNLGLDPVAFKADLDSGRFAQAIHLSEQSAERLQVRGTPAFLLGALSPDGQVLRVSRVLLGAPDYATFREILDGLLAPESAASTSESKATGGSTCG